MPKRDRPPESNPLPRSATIRRDETDSRSRFDPRPDSSMPKLGQSREIDFPLGLPQTATAARSTPAGSTSIQPGHPMRSEPDAAKSISRPARLPAATPAQTRPPRPGAAEPDLPRPAPRTPSANNGIALPQ